jgi:putative FmdB family regulatory protein
MITYEYECESCGIRFERRQAITDEPVTACPECRGKVRQIVSGGSGFVIKGRNQTRNGGNCSFELSGKTCCGQDKRCETPSCEIES